MHFGGLVFMPFEVLMREMSEQITLEEFLYDTFEY